MRFKSLNNGLGEKDDGDDFQKEMNLKGRPNGMKEPENAPDLPEEMPEYLEKELDELKKEDNYGVIIIYKVFRLNLL